MEEVEKKEDKKKCEKEKDVEKQEEVHVQEIKLDNKTEPEIEDKTE